MEGSEKRNYQGMSDQAQEKSLHMCACVNHEAGRVDAQWKSIDWFYSFVYDLAGKYNKGWLVAKTEQLEPPSLNFTPVDHVLSQNVGICELV